MSCVYLFLSFSLGLILGVAAMAVAVAGRGDD